MIELPKRTFTASPAVRRQVPLWIGLFGASGSGKTYSALRLAEGLAETQGGPIYGVDTEAGRMLHYADRFKFQHVPFGEPYGSLDYLAAIKFALADNKTGKRPTVIIDSMSHEHEGPGGMIDLQDQLVRKMATWDGVFDAKKADRVKMLAWAEPKAKRRALINGMLGLEANFILCFRAKESSKPVSKVERGSNGKDYTKTEVVAQGFVPIGGDDFVYECTLSALLLPGAKGKPSWSSAMPGEGKMIKVPEQFKDLEQMRDRALDEEVGSQLARWADGAADGAASEAAKPKGSATEWTDWFIEELETCATSGEVSAHEQENAKGLSKLQAGNLNLHKRVKDAVSARLTAIDLA